MHLDLSRPELEELQALVDARVSDLPAEIHHAMVTGYREQLKERKALLERLALKLREAAVSAEEPGGEGGLR